MKSDEQLINEAYDQQNMLKQAELMADRFIEDGMNMLTKEMMENKVPIQIWKNVFNKVSTRLNHIVEDGDWGISTADVLGVEYTENDELPTDDMLD